MEKFTIKYKDFMFESLEDKFKEKLSDYVSLKRGLLLLLDNSVENAEELVNVQNFINNYKEKPNDATLVGFVDDAEIFDFYIKYQGDIDEICSKTNFFDKTPKENNIFSLYAIIIEGTKYAVKECFTYLEKDMF